MKLAIIGGGNMGLAMYERLTQSFSPKKVWLCDTHPEKREKAQQSCSDISEIKDQVNAVIFSIKPQSFEHWSTKLPHHLIFSIMAGIPLKRLESQTGSKKVVRSMPNRALKIGESVTGWIAASALSDADRTFAHSLFSAFGYAIEVDLEEKIDAITAISGSGPAYFFYLCEHMIEKAKAYGFNADEAKKMVMQTLKGASVLLEEGKGEAAQLRKTVTSEKGTTNAATSTLDQGGFPKLFSQALDAAKNRAEELSQ